MAGILAAEIAARWRERVKASVMLGPVLPSAGVKEAFEGRVSTVEKEGMEAMANTIPTSATGETTTPLQHAFIRTLLLSQKPEGYISMSKVVGGASVPEYDKIEMPTLLVAGSADKSAPLAGCEEIFNRTGGRKSMEVIEGMGHWHCVEEPEKVAELIGRFVESVIKGT
ncbi:hypothetical protein MMC21_003144 [Puttea exsequens]|nr:hypothetical protein [Puttea exsequens]